MYWYILIQNGFRWTAEELKKVIDMLRRPIVREIMEDPIFKGNQNYKFEMELDEAGKRLYGGETNTGVAFQIGQLTYIFSMYKLVCASMYRHVLACTSLLLHALVCRCVNLIACPSL